MARLHVTVKGLLEVYSCIVVVGWFVLMYRIGTAPAEPNITTGQIVATEEHGKVIYITSLEHVLLNYVAPIAILLLICAGAAEARRSPTPNTSPERTRER